jgi:hypothetical protein
VVWGVAVSPGVPAYSTRERGALSARARSRAGGAAAGGGAGARSPGRMPALKAAAVGRITRTCRPGGVGFAAGAVVAIPGGCHRDPGSANRRRLRHRTPVSPREPPGQAHNTRDGRCWALPALRLGQFQPTGSVRQSPRLVPLRQRLSTGRAAF